MFPPLSDANFWENKAFMHREFDRLGIPSPETTIIRISQLAELDKPDFPFLLKRIHSCESKGLYKIESEKDLQSTIRSLKSENQEEEILVQKILNMRRDIRVIMVGGKVVHYYWRINLSDTWRPTATSKGNKVDFENFPEAKRITIENYFKQLNLTAGAFDIAWQNDDLSNTPIVLEVSPVFSPNPTTHKQTHLENYGKFKKQLSLKGYDYNYVNEIFRIKKNHLDTSFNKV
jgi:glutathione synthase/RimK-type ligase-like ATP-grasp enzyme